MSKEKQPEQTETILQECECCISWVNQERLLWDLEEERLVCKECYSKPQTQIKGV